MKGKDGKVHQYGFAFKQEVKSLVWYSPDNFAEKGYKVPKTWEDLMALQEKIKADGGTPWCIGIESGGATGWPATDWIEDIMLRTQPPEVYDGWVTNTIKFNDPRIVAAIDTFGSIAKDDENVAGGVKAVATTAFGDSPKGLFTVPPQCYLHHQASFIPAFFPEGREGRRGLRLLLPSAVCLASGPGQARCWVRATSSPSPRTRRPRARSSTS